MIDYVVRRFLYMVLTVLAVSVVAFGLIQLPPGDYLTTYIAQLEEEGSRASEEELLALRLHYGLDRPLYAQYAQWVWRIVTRGDFGRSFAYDRPAKDLIWERLAMTAIMAMATLVFTYVVSIPIGIYSALNKYSPGDFFFTVIGYTGLATPNFLLALILMYVGFQYLGASVGGLFSPQYLEAGWSVGKVLDMLSHLWIPVIVLGTAGTAGLIRVMRIALRA